MSFTDLLSTAQQVLCNEEKKNNFVNFASIRGYKFDDMLRLYEVIHIISKMDSFLNGKRPDLLKSFIKVVWEITEFLTDLKQYPDEMILEITKTLKSKKDIISLPSSDCFKKLQNYILTHLVSKLPQYFTDTTDSNNKENIQNGIKNSGKSSKRKSISLVKIKSKIDILTPRPTKNNNETITKCKSDINVQKQNLSPRDERQVGFDSQSLSPITLRSSINSGFSKELTKSQSLQSVYNRNDFYQSKREATTWASPTSNIQQRKTPSPHTNMSDVVAEEILSALDVSFQEENQATSAKNVEPNSLCATSVPLSPLSKSSTQSTSIVGTRAVADINRDADANENEDTDSILILDADTDVDENIVDTIHKEVEQRVSDSVGISDQIDVYDLSEGEIQLITEFLTQPMTESSSNTMSPLQSSRDVSSCNTARKVQPERWIIVRRLGASRGGIKLKIETNSIFQLLKQSGDKLGICASKIRDLISLTEIKHVAALQPQHVVFVTTQSEEDLYFPQL